MQELLRTALMQQERDVERLKAGLAMQNNALVVQTLEQSTSAAKSADAASLHIPANKQAVEMLVHLSWEQLHLGHWKDVLMEWRDLYAHPEPMYCAPSSAQPNPSLQEAMRVLDLGIMMGGPTFKQALHKATSDLGEMLARQQTQEQQQPDEGQPPEKKTRTGSQGSIVQGAADLENTAGQEAASMEDEEEASIGMQHCGGVSNWRAAGAVKLPPYSLHLGHEGCTQPPVSHLPPLEVFLVKFMMAPGGGQPVIITGALESWPALTRWQDLQYLARVAGHRTVPIEVGPHYLDQEWGQQLMTLSDFIAKHVAQKEGQEMPKDAKRRGYLAQHPLFDQVPALAADVQTPEYCALSEDEEGGGLQAVNAWFGPAATVTPLHTDPHHNLLAQVVGRKYVRLYAPSHTDSLYPFQEGLTTNTSQVDLDAPDHERFPLSSKLPHVDCLLEPGQMLFIPKGWWHYVKSLSVSFSVSFWWK